jgi:hypothetical protein
MSAAVYARANTDHLTLLSQSSASQDIDKEDVIAAHAKSQFTRIFTAPLSDHYNIMNPNRFVAWTRAFLRIPQLPHLGSLSDRHNLQYQTEICLSGHAFGKTLFWICMATTHAQTALPPQLVCTVATHYSSVPCFTSHRKPVAAWTWNRQLTTSSMVSTPNSSA